MPTIRSLDVYLLPALVDPAALSGKAVTVIDVLRATTTIIQGLAAGATQVIPCLEVDEAHRAAAKIGKNTVLGGERGGKQIPGFTLGNSPAEYTPEQVAAKSIVFTTTNGTRAMLHCRGARRVLIGAFVNFSALCRELGDEEEIVLLCAGTDGHVTREDALLAGAVVDELCSPRIHRSSGHKGAGYRLNDQAEIAADAWRSAVRYLTDRPLGMMLRASRGGRNLIEIGQESDIDLAAQIDKFDIVPELDLATWRIRLP
jgi:2-phosphosulfolactate phosphatase